MVYCVINIDIKLSFCDAILIWRCREMKSPYIDKYFNVIVHLKDGETCHFDHCNISTLVRIETLFYSSDEFTSIEAVICEDV